MELLVIGVVALLTSGLSLFSGFGLGTILMPVFALFFPVLLAIAAITSCISPTTCSNSLSWPGRRIGARSSALAYRPRRGVVSRPSTVPAAQYRTIHPLRTHNACARLPREASQ